MGILVSPSFFKNEKDDMATYARKLKDASGNYVAPATRSSVVYLSDGSTLDDFIAKIYPVGSVYMSIDSTSPASMYGGTWEAIVGRFLLGSSETHAVDSWAGEETHTLTVAETPPHNHYNSGNGLILYTDNQAAISQNPIDNGVPRISGWMTLPVVGEGKAHNNMPPYYTVNIWKRNA